MRMNEIVTRRMNSEVCKTGRKSFYESWLSEMPMGLNQPNDISYICRIINEFAPTQKIIDLGNNLYKMNIDPLFYYWYGPLNNIEMGIEIEKTPHALVVNTIAKRNSGIAPFASDLYLAILNDNKGNTNVRLSSDKFLSDDALKIWKRLVSTGHKISVYDNTKPGHTFTPIETENDLLKYFKHGDSTYSKHQYVLSESEGSFIFLKSRFEYRKKWETLLPDDLIND